MANPTCKSDRGCFRFKKNRPRFFKIILQETIDDGKLRIPGKLVKRYGDDLSNIIILEDPTGAKWKVELVKTDDDGQYWFKNGFKEFAENYSLSAGSLLVFECESSILFHVVIFDRTALEIDYPFSTIHVDEEPHLEEELQEQRMEEFQEQRTEKFRMDEFQEQRRVEFQEQRRKEFQEQRMEDFQEQRMDKFQEQRREEFQESRMGRNREVIDIDVNVDEEPHLKEELQEQRMEEFQEQIMDKFRREEFQEQRRKEFQEQRMEDFQEQRMDKFQEQRREEFQESRMGRNREVIDIDVNVDEEPHLEEDLQEQRMEEFQEQRTDKFRREEFQEQRRKEFQEQRMEDFQEQRMDKFQEQRREEFQESRMGRNREDIDIDVNVDIMEEDLTLDPKTKEKLLTDKTGDGSTKWKAAAASTGDESLRKKKKKLPCSHHLTQQIGGGERGRKQMLNGVTKRLKPLKTNDKHNVLRRANAAFRSKNPFFMVAMQLTYIFPGNSINIPQNFAKTYFKEKYGPVILRISDGRTWTAKYVTKLLNRQPVARFEHCCWRAFMLDNNLEVGDVCVFELIKDTKLSLKVSIFRATEFANGSLSLTDARGVDQVRQKKSLVDNTEFDGNRMDKARISIASDENITRKADVKGSNQFSPNKSLVDETEFDDNRMDEDIISIRGDGNITGEADVGGANQVRSNKSLVDKSDSNSSDESRKFQPYDESIAGEANRRGASKVQPNKSLVDKTYSDGNSTNEARNSIPSDETIAAEADMREVNQVRPNKSLVDKTESDANCMDEASISSPCVENLTVQLQLSGSKFKTGPGKFKKSELKNVTGGLVAGGFEAESNFTSTYPFFKVVLRSCFTESVPAPFSFIERHIKDNIQTVKLQVADRLWPVKLISYHSFKIASLSDGWAKFATENYLQAGDACVFELIKSDILKVCVFRTTS